MLIIVLNLLSLLKNGNNAMEISESLPHKISTKLWNCLNELCLYYVTIWFKLELSDNCGCHMGQKQDVKIYGICGAANARNLSLTIVKAETGLFYQLLVNVSHI